jgi:NAD(P)-dependent dehydrogenase (short-subunit alcohol dehydrogenase family)
MDLDLGGSVVLITGGTDGLGAALADRLVLEGCRVAFCGRDEGRVRATEDRLVAVGGDALGVVADVTVTNDLERFADAAVSRWGRIDGLVNNAGQSAGGRLESVPDEKWAYDLDLKLMAAVRLIRLVLPHMRAAGGGSIVNILNTSSKAPGATSLPTAASRAGGLAITKALSKDVGSDNIRVNAVLIGAIKSGQGRRRAEAAGVSEETIYAEQAKSIPLGRVGTGDDFADLVSYLLSKRAGFVTGSAINLDGGASPVL